MKRRKSLKIGFLTDHLYYSLPLDMHRGIKKGAKEYNIGLTTFCGAVLSKTEDYTRQSNILYNIAGSENVDGIIIASNIISYNISAQELTDFCHSYKDFPVVSLGLVIEGIPSIVLENKSGMYEIVDHLIKKHNRKKIVFISGPESNLDAQERLEAYKEALEDNGLTPDPEMIIPGNFEPASGTRAIRNLLDKMKKKPKKDFDSIVCANDYMARNAVIELQESGVKIPEDIIVTGFDNVFPVKFIFPPITTVSISFEEIGELSIKVLLDQIEGRPVEDVYHIKPRTHFRESCGCSEPIFQDFHENVYNQEYINLLSGKTPEEYFNSLNREVVTNQINSYDLSSWIGIFNILKENINKKIDVYSETDIPFCNSNSWKILSESIYITFKKKDLDSAYLNVSQKLNRTVQLKQIINILVNDLPDFGINQCFLILYEDPPEYKFPQKPPEKSRLVMVMNNGRDEAVPVSGIVFPTEKLLPDKYMKMTENKSVIIEALYFQETQIGYCIFQENAGNKSVYSNMQTQISSSIQSAMLVRKVQENAKQLKEANKKIQTLNEELNEENLEMRAEMKIAEKIQTALLPRQEELEHRDFEISGFMYPAKEVGGDYYDVINDKNSCLWLGIGDVSGHGITPGLVMMMTQTMHSLITRKYEASPKDIVILINSILHKNVSERLEESKYMTFTSLKYLGNGRFQFAGLHLDIIIYRNKLKRCETIATNGTWLNLMPDIDEITENSEFTLEKGDVMVLYTDGITEAFNKKREMFGLSGLIETIEKNPSKNPNTLQEAVINEILNWTDGNILDDISLLIARRK